ncbi:MAG TPA: hypothetical protein VFO85_15010 [Vicinamibacteria bacterium]|nr:hypothetical protein [Vicinamibacteria bacterium]
MILSCLARRLQAFLLLLPLAVPAPAPAADPPPADGQALIEKAVAAFGGAAAVDAVTGLELRARGTRRVQADDLPVTTLTRYHFPDRYYQELALPMGTLKTVLGPKSAFIVAGEGAMPLPEGERQSILKLMQRNVLAVLRARRQPGFRAQVVGADTVEGAKVQLVRVTRGTDVVTLGIEPVTGEVRQTRFDSAGGATTTGTLVVTYSDYRPAGTLLRLRYPYRSIGVMSGTPAFSQMVEAVIVNPKVEAQLFEAPPPHAMFPGVEDLPLSPPPTLLPRPGASPSTPPRE